MRTLPLFFPKPQSPSCGEGSSHWMCLRPLNEKEAGSNTRLFWQLISSLGIVEASILAVWSLARLAAPEVTGRNRFAVALVRQQLNEPSLVLDFFIQNTSRHVIRTWILTESHVADLAPTANGATL